MRAPRRRQRDGRRWAQATFAFAAQRFSRVAIGSCGGTKKIDIARGAWRMAHGAWRMAHGAWRMAHHDIDGEVGGTGTWDMGMYGRAGLGWGLWRS